MSLVDKIKGFVFNAAAAFTLSYEFGRKPIKDWQPDICPKVKTIEDPHLEHLKAKKERKEATTNEEQERLKESGYDFSLFDATPKIHMSPAAIRDSPPNFLTYTSSRGSYRDDSLNYSILHKDPIRRRPIDNIRLEVGEKAFDESRGKIGPAYQARWDILVTKVGYDIISALEISTFEQVADVLQILYKPHFQFSSIRPSTNFYNGLKQSFNDGVFDEWLQRQNDQTDKYVEVDEPYQESWLALTTNVPEAENLPLDDFYLVAKAYEFAKDRSESKFCDGLRVSIERDTVERWATTIIKHFENLGIGGGNYRVVGRVA